MRVDPNLVRSLHRAVGDQMQRQQLARRGRGDRLLAGLGEQQYARKLIADEIRAHAERLLDRGEPLMDSEREEELAEAVHARMYGAGRLQSLLNDEQIEDIDINGCDEVWVTRAGEGGGHPAEPVATTDAELIELVQTLASYTGLSSRPWDSANPELDLRLPDGSRLSAIQGLSARPAVSIRRNRMPKATLGDLIGLGTLSEDAAVFLTAAVKARFNIMLAGGTGAGKTTMLRALAAEIDSAERIITVEKALELGLRSDTARHPNCVELEERIANSEGHGAVAMKDLVRRTLRMNPDRVIVGEVLGDEVITMLNAMSQGNDGSLSTIHTRSAREVFNRIATYAIQGGERLPHEASYQLIAGGLDFVVYLSRELHTGHRRVETVLEVNGFDNGVQASEIFQTGETGLAEWNGVMPARIERLAAAGWRPHAGEW